MANPVEDTTLVSLDIQDVIDSEFTELYRNFRSIVWQELGGNAMHSLMKWDGGADHYNPTGQACDIFADGRRRLYLISDGGSFKDSVRMLRARKQTFDIRAYDLGNDAYAISPVPDEVIKIAADKKANEALK